MVPKPQGLGSEVNMTVDLGLKEDRATTFPAVGYFGFEKNEKGTVFLFVLGSFQDNSLELEQTALDRGC